MAHEKCLKELYSKCDCIKDTIEEIEQLKKRIKKLEEMAHPRNPRDIKLG